jgi:hypothetical protein
MSSSSDAHPFSSFGLHAARVVVRDRARALRPDVLRDQMRHEIRVQRGEHLRDAAAGRIAPHHDVA